MIFNFINTLAARDSGENIFVQIIVMAAIIGFGILKKIVSDAKIATEQKHRQNDEKEHQPLQHNKTTRKYISGPDDEYKTLEQLRDEKRAQIRVAFGIPTPLEDKKPVSIPPEPPRPVKKIEKPIYHAKTARPYAKEVGKKPSGVSAPLQTEAGDMHKLLFSSPQDLRTAVLYYEILGKPVSLRDAV
jgi:hypothetical protein